MIIHMCNGIEFCCWKCSFYV